MAAPACVSHDVSGHACIVLDIRKPGLCGAMQIVDGLSVVDLESGHRTQTDSDGNFSVPLPEHARSAVLQIAEGRPDRITSVVGVPDAPADDVLVPVITTTLWTTYLTGIHVPPQDPSTATIHVSFPFPGVYLGGAQIEGAAQVIYDQGDAFNWGPTPPGDQTIALMALGVPTDAGSVMLNAVLRTDQVIFNAPVPVQAGAITWVYIDPAKPQL